ncbi:hypothetical protein ZIOFF_019081 [Zingiber officinale]|uniref:Pentatricopeptide repeat-containing protein n=1 Tax=Zingiber officinale TaxID=94328 RepID=A0A8J5H925_ZINOF|nr:hypothetical protein ZIOFF_019081 [Zingiber officinale]
MEVYARNGRVPLARRLFEEMPLRDVGLEVNQVTMAVLLQACYGSEDKVAGCQLQAFANKAGLQSHESLQNSILSMFNRLACFEEVMKFVIIQNRSIASWNILLSSYSFIGDVSRVVKCYRKMRLEVTPSSETLTLPISAFAKCEHLPGGRENGELLEAANVFERMQKSVIKPCKDALRALVVAYTNLGALLLGRGVHNLM